MLNLAAGIGINSLDNTLYGGESKVKWILVFHLCSEQDMNLQWKAVAPIHDILQGTAVQYALNIWIIMLLLIDTF